MPQLTSVQANELANQFLALSQAIDNFRNYHWSDLSSEQLQQLAERQISVVNYGEDILALSTALVMNDVSKSLTSISEVTAHIKSTLGSLADIDKGITVSASVVMLGAAIVSENPVAIAGAIEDLVAKWK